MSFSTDVKDELYTRFNKARHCRVAELAAIISFGCDIKRDGDKIVLMPVTGGERLRKKYFSLISKTTDIRGKEIIEGDDALKVLRVVKLYDETLEDETDYIDGLILQQPCCKRAYIRGAFLASGTISDPNKSYHFEITAKTKRQAVELQEALEFFEIKAGVVSRKKHFAVYLKDSSKIVDILNIMEAHKSLMNLENVRIVKEVRGQINRKVNCETANIKRTINACVKQIEDIKFIRDNIGLSELPETLEEMAIVRLEHPDTSLQELGTFLKEPIGKSGVNHRLRRISKIADELREQEG